MKKSFYTLPHLNGLKMKNALLILITLLAFTFCSKNDSHNSSETEMRKHAENTERFSFLNKIKLLQKGKLDSLKISPAIKIKINPLDENASEITAGEAEKTEISSNDFLPLTPTGILKITGNYILILLHDKYSDEIRAATFTPDGKPLETILLFSQTGNNEFKLSRAYSYMKNIPYFFDSSKNEFQFTDMRYDTEWIEYPVKGKETLTYKIKFTIRVNDKGHFVIVLQ